MVAFAPFHVAVSSPAFPGSSRGSGHSFALLGAALALVSAALAMLGIMLATFFSAGAANLGTHATDVGGEFRASRHQHGCGSANSGAIAIQPDTSRHHLHVLLTQAFSSAMRAFVGAVITSFDAIQIFLVRHKNLLVSDPAPTLQKRKE